MVAMWLLTYMLIVGDKETGGQRDGETERRTDSEDLQRQIDRKHDTLCNILKANSSPSFHVKLVLRLGPCVLQTPAAIPESWGGGGQSVNNLSAAPAAFVQLDLQRPLAASASAAFRGFTGVLL